MPLSNPACIPAAGSGSCLRDDLVYLAETLGERPTGSEKNRQAARYIHATLAGCGFDAGFQQFPIGEWKPEGIDLSCGGKTTDAAANPYSPACDLTAPLAAAGSLAELENANLKGRILLAHGDLTREPLMPRNFRFYRHEEHCRIAQLIEDKGAAAVIAVSPRDDQPVPVIIDRDLSVPSCTITAASGLSLLDRAGSPVSLCIRATTHNVTAANIIGRSGDPAGKKKLVLSAHFDTKFYTPGALDNAAGVAVLLELARRYRKKPWDIPTEMVFFNGEECYCAPGECAYIDAGHLDPAQVRLGINVDGVGLSGWPAGISYYGCPDELVSASESLRAQYPGIVRMDPWPQGDHMAFFMNSIPCIAFSTKADPTVIDRVIHSRHDTPEILDEETIGAVTGMIEKIIRHIAL